MGCYVNPSNEPKEDFLKREGVELRGAPKWGEMPDCLPVCLVDNGAFTAAGVCFSPGELEASTYPDDNRPKRWYLVETAKLRNVAPNLDDYVRSS